jgi:hypothetical protein
MSKRKKPSQTDIYEFLPFDDITSEEILELAQLIRIGVCGSVLENASEKLKRHFEKIDT